MIRGWDPIIPVWRWLYSQAPANQQSFGGVGVSTPCGAVSTRGITVVHVWKDLWSEDGTPLSPANVGFILEPQAISNRSVGFGFPHRARRCRPGGSPSSSASCRSCRYKEGLLSRGWGPLLPGCVGIVGFPRGAPPAARAAPPQRPRAGRGGRLGQLDLGSENAGIKVICLLCYIRDDAAAMQNLLVVLGATSVMLLLLSMLRTLWVDYHSGMILYCSTANKFGIWHTVKYLQPIHISTSPHDRPRGLRNTCALVVDADLRSSYKRKDSRRWESWAYHVNPVACGALHRSRTRGAFPHLSQAKPFKESAHILAAIDLYDHPRPNTLSHSPLTRMSFALQTRFGILDVYRWAYSVGAKDVSTTYCTSP